MTARPVKRPEVGVGSAGVGSPAALRRANRRRVLDLLGREGPASQAKIARGTGLSRATVSNIVRELGSQEWVTRGPSAVSLNPRAGFVAGLDFGHRHVRVAVADLGHRVLAECCRELPSNHGVEEDVPVAAAMLDGLLDRVRVRRPSIIAVGLGLPAPVDPATGEVRAPAILPGWVGVAAAEAVGDSLGLPVVVDNDANLGALAEHTWGAGAGVTDLVYVKVATGVGAGLVLGGEVYHGAGGVAGEIGHVTVDERGALCQCGDRGCLQTVAGAEAILSLLRAAHGDALTLPEVIARALSGDHGCRRVLADAGRAVGVAVAGACSLLAPQRVVVGGTLATAGAIVLGPLRDVVRRHTIHTIAEQAQIVPGHLGERAELLGAIALALRQLDRFGADRRTGHTLLGL